MDDIGHAIHYTAVEPGTPVYSSDGTEVGRVEEMLDNHREHIFDGVVFVDRGGVRRFADAPEVARTAEGGVVLAIDAAEALLLDPPEKGPAKLVPSPGGGLLGRLFGGARKRS
jgi:hypothetical protein